MYKIKLDLRANDGKVITAEEAGGYILLQVEDGDVELEIDFGYRQWNSLTDSVGEQCGLKTYSNICDK